MLMSMIPASTQVFLMDLLMKWELNTVLKNVRSLLVNVGSWLMIIVGVTMIIVGIFKIAQGLMSHGKTQVNWVVNILLIVVGALFCAGAAFFKSLTASGEGSVGGALADELNALGND